MSIDWITVSAQIINFLILVWLLKRFLFQPVINAMDSREQRIANRLKEAEHREQEAEQQRQAYVEKQTELDNTRQERLASVEQEADKAKHELLEDARHSVDDAREQWLQELQQEQRELADDLRQNTISSVETIARKALSDLANSELETQIVSQFMQQLKSLDAVAREQMSQPGEPLTVQTSHPLSPRQKDLLVQAIHECLDNESAVEYEVATELVSGIALKANGRILGWNLRDYLSELNQGIDAILTRPGSSPD